MSDCNYDIIVASTLSAARYEVPGPRSPCPRHRQGTRWLTRVTASCPISCPMPGRRTRSHVQARGESQASRSRISAVFFFAETICQKNRNNTTHDPQPQPGSACRCTATAPTSTLVAPTDLLHEADRVFAAHDTCELRRGRRRIARRADLEPLPLRRVVRVLLAVRRRIRPL